MKTAEIRIGAVIMLKPQVFEGSVGRDGQPLASNCIVVEAIKDRPAYRVPWIRCDRGNYYKPSDLLRELNPQADITKLILRNHGFEVSDVR